MKEKKDKPDTPKSLTIDGESVEFDHLNNIIDWRQLESKVGFFNFDMSLNEFRSYLSLLFLHYNYEDNLENLFTIVGDYQSNIRGKQYYNFALHTPFLSEIKLEGLKNIENHILKNDLVKYFRPHQELPTRKKPKKPIFGSTHNVINTNRFKSVI